MRSRNSRFVQSCLENLAEKDGIEVKKHPEQDRWIVSISVASSEFEKFTVEVFLEDSWLSFSALVMKNLQGQKLSTFYEATALLSSYLNLLKVAIDPENDHLVIQNEIDLSMLNHHQKEQAIRKILNLFYAFFVEYYPELIKLAAELGLQYRADYTERSQASLFVKHMIDKDSRMNLNSSQKPLSADKRFFPLKEFK